MSLNVWQLDPAQLTPYYDRALCSALARAGCTVRYFTSPYLYDPALPAPVGYRIEHLYFRGLHHPRWLAYPRLRRLLRAASYLSGHRRLVAELDRSPPDVIHIQWSRLPRFDRWLVEQIRQRGIPLVHTVHDVEPLFDHVSSPDLAHIYALADKLIVHTNANRALFLARHPNIRADSVEVIPHIAADWHMPSHAHRLAARRELGLLADAPIILCFGTPRPYKNLDLLLEAFADARRACPALVLLVAGRVANSETLRRLKRLAPHVIVRPGYVPSDQVWMYHRAADVAVFPYQRISQSGALITAMIFGLPVIVTDVGGLPETVDGNGWVVPVNDPVALATALAAAGHDHEHLQALGSRSLELIEQHHAPGKIAQTMISTYEAVVRLCSASSTVPTA